MTEETVGADAAGDKPTGAEGAGGAVGGAVGGLVGGVDAMGADVVRVGGAPSLMALSKEGMMAVHASGRAFSVALCKALMMEMHASGRVGVEGGTQAEQKNGRPNRRKYWTAE